MSKFAGVTDTDLAAQFGEKKTAFDALIALDTPTDEQVEQAEALASEIEEIVTEQDGRKTAAAARAAKFEALKTRTFGVEDEANEDEDDEEEESEEDADSDEADAEADAEVEVEVEVAPEATASSKTTKAATTKKTVAAIARRTKRPEAPSNAKPTLSIVAAADVPEVPAGSSLGNIEALSAAVVNRMRGFAPPQGDGSTENLQKFGVASIQTKFPDDLIIDRGTDEFAVMSRAGDESRLESASGKGSLVAAGGWCAPSETLYDLASDESLEGILSLPEVQVKRGGIRFTEGPQFADFYANAGFIQTEAQAIAGTTKPCYTVECPDWTDIRLDAVGICIKVPILTNAAYPELVQRFTSGSLIAHQHMVNANVIGRMVALSGALRTFGGLGSTASDTLEALELVIMQRRQSQRLSLTRTVEVVVPFWVKGAIRADIGRRNGRDKSAVSDAEIAAHFSAIAANVSYVYDWQDLPTVDDAGTVGVDEANTYPTTFRALVYPAGTFVKGTSAVINLSAVYDAASLAENTYTGLFMEEGLLVAKRQYGSDYVELPVCNAGRTGAADFTCA
jgi:hypothetical protein